MNVGRSILQMLWEELDKLTDNLMRNPDSELRFVAKGVATCIAILLNPYNPDLDAVRAEAVQRWKDRQL